MEEITKHFSNYAKTYPGDKRKDIKLLYKSFLSLPSSSWIIESLDEHIIKERNKKVTFPVLSLRTKKKGKAVWILSGTHGEEPAGPIAISENMDFFKKLSEQGTPLVIIPLSNPSGYYRNWRYLFHWKNWSIGKSMGDCEPFLLDEHNKPRKKSTHPRAEKFTKHILSLVKDYPPLFVLDLHEDEITTMGGDPFYKGDEVDVDVTYIYSQGKFGYKDLIANKIVGILKYFKHPIKTEGVVQTDSNEKIVNGIVSKIKDGSIDELLASNKIFLDNKIVKGPSAKTVIVIETLTNIPLSERVKIYNKILQSIKEFIKLSKKQN
jgi:hypothetical protein